MEYLGDKLNSFTSETVSGINELKRKRKERNTRDKSIDDNKPTMETIQEHRHEQHLSGLSKTTGIYGFDLERIKRTPLSKGVPFGGDSTYAPSRAPAIGFKMIDDNSTAPAETAPEESEKEHRKQGETDADSTLSLYEGDTWSRLWFQRVMFLTLIRLLIFIRKVYEDYTAFKKYSIVGHAGHFLISGATLLLPTVVFTLYRVSRYLQIALPSKRLEQVPMSIGGNMLAIDNKGTVISTRKNDYDSANKSSKDIEDAQSRRALMSSPTDSIPQSTQPPEEDGLATARQTPTNLNEEFHDTQDQTDREIELPIKPITSNVSSIAKSTGPNTTVTIDTKLESVNVEKLGNLPDKKTAKIIIGASEQILHGVLFIFWQLKRQVDVIGYLVDRSCLWRKPKEIEKEQLGRLRFSGDGLEWFQDFYAAFLAILTQVYVLGSYWSSDSGGDNRTGPNKLTAFSSSASGLAGMNSENQEQSISNAARIISSTLLSGNSGDDLLITSEILVSCAVVISLLVAVRRNDDGPLTLGLSMLGWGSIFASRIIIIAMAFVHIGWKIMIALVTLHIAMFTSWIYKIAIDSHNDAPGESEESRWDQGDTPIEDGRTELTQINNEGLKTNNHTTDSKQTSQWSAMEHVVLIAQILTLFAIPSLFYWPIMFNMKLHARPFKYLAIIMSQNFILIAAIWYIISSTATSAQWYLLGSVGTFSIVGFIFVSLYIACKPSLTEYFARADEIINEAEKSGIYYEFCSRVFKMPDLTKHTFTRLMNQTEQVEEIDISNE